MRKLQIKFPNQIRISGWDFGSSARAMNQAGEKDLLMTYESVSNTQAELERVSNSTTERKSMSTKTSIKRIALVAVAALGFGLVTGVTANAATTPATSFTANTPVATTISVNDTAVINYNLTTASANTNTTTVTASFVAPIGSTVATAGTTLFQAGTVTAGSGAQAGLVETYTATGNNMSVANGQFSFVADVAGTYQVTLTTTGGLARTISFFANPIAVAPDAIRLSSVNAVKAVYANSANTTGLPGDQVVVAAGGLISTVLNNGLTTGTVKLRADLVSYPTNGYASTTADTTAGTQRNFDNAAAVATPSSNLLTISSTSFDPCDPTVATDLPAIYDVSPNLGNILTNKTCDSIIARAGYTATATGVANRNPQGLGFFKFTPVIAGTYVLRVWQDVDGNGFVNPNGGEVYTDLSITVSAFGAANAQYSTAYINAAMGTTGVAYNRASTCIDPATGVTYTATAYAALQGTYVCDETVLAPKGTLSAPAKVARIYWVLKDSLGVALDSRSTFDPVYASISGPGNISLSVDGATATTPTGRSIVATPATKLTNSGVGHAGYVDVYNDGTGGTSTITLTIGSLSWTKTVSFYGPATTVTATQGRYVLPMNVAGTYGCVPANPWPVSSPTACGGLTVATSVAVSLAAKDANGIAVPYVTYTSASSDATKLAAVTTASAGSYAVPYLGATWFSVSALGGNNPSGSSATLTFTTNQGTTLAPVNVSGAALTFKFGGALASATSALGAESTNVGQLNGLTFTGKDAAGNAAYDADLAYSLTTDYAVQTALGQPSTTLSGTTLPMWNGSALLEFYNPITLGTTKFTGYIGSTLTPVSASLTTTSVNPTSSDAIDAANEATDAANAATDAANAAAEAADAATAAAQDAQAAVAELATKVASLIAGIKAQITTLTNLVIKIQKKVKA